MELNIYNAKEAQVIQGCKRKDKTSQKALFDTFSPSMYAVCFRYLQHGMDAEDVMVSAFMKVFDKIDQYRGEGSLGGWIRRIMVNESLTHLRKNKSVYLELEIEKAKHEPDYQQISDRLYEADLLKLIESLPPGYRIVFNMYAIDGYSHKEIAAKLGISENTSKSQLSRARTYLQQKLLEFEIEENKIIQS